MLRDPIQFSDNLRRPNRLPSNKQGLQNRFATEVHSALFASLLLMTLLGSHSAGQSNRSTITGRRIESLVSTLGLETPRDADRRGNWEQHPQELSNSSNENAAEKTVTIPMRTSGPRTLDPANSATVYDSRVISQVYESLLEYHYLKRPTGAATLQPLLLAEMPTVSADGLTYHFKLRSDVYFHDDPCFADGVGRRLVASDVVYSWKRLADEAIGARNWWLLEDLVVGLDAYRRVQNANQDFDYDEDVEGMRLINELEFEIVLTEPVYRFMYLLARTQLAVVPREAIETYGDRIAIHPVGTGPFTISEGDWDFGSQIVMKKNREYRRAIYPVSMGEDYEGKQLDIETGLYESEGSRIPLVDQVNINFYPDDQQMWLRFEAHELAFIDVPEPNFLEAYSPTTGDLRRRYEEAGIVSHVVPLLDLIYHGFNMEDELVGGYDADRIALRQAIALAIDWEERNETFYGNRNVIYDGMIPPGLDGYPDRGRSPVDLRGPDLDRARELLAAAGYADGEGLPAIDHYSSNSVGSVEQAQMLTRQLSRIGIRINIRSVDFATLISAITQGEAPFFSLAWGADYPDGENMLALFYGPNRSPGANMFNYANDDFDQWYRQIRIMRPSAERDDLYGRMRDTVIADSPFIGSMARTRHYLQSPDVKNFKPSDVFHNWYKYLDVEP